MTPMHPTTMYFGDVPRLFTSVEEYDEAVAAGWRDAPFSITVAELPEAPERRAIKTKHGKKRGAE